MKTLISSALRLWLMSTVILTGSAGEPPGAHRTTPSAPEILPSTNSANFVDVTRADGDVVQEPIVASATYQESLAAANTTRMKAILNSPHIGEYCRIHFPAGSYYFHGAAPEWTASIQTTAKHQSITGDGIHATRILQKSTAVAATVKISHSNCTIQNLSILSADYQSAYNREWDEHPHQAAILLETLPTNPPWHTDPQVLNVNINATGNNITLDGFYRPFQTGIKSLGPWLNIYAHTMFILHVHNAIYIDQGEVIAGPAKFIDINAYAPAPTDAPHMWNTFFKSEGRFMEQVELIHCTYIGSQFISMDGSPRLVDHADSRQPPTNPVYNMVVDHCYINSLWLPCPTDEPKWSGIYMHLPPKPGGIDPNYGSELYSRTLVFTYNQCAGKTPRDGAFLYVEGNVRELTIHGNEFSSGGGDRCIQVRATDPLLNTDVGVKDIAITSNYFNDFRRPITIGDGSPALPGEEPDPPPPDPPRTTGESAQPARNPCWVEGVLITGNQTFCLPILERIQRAHIAIDYARQVTVSGNRFAKTNGSSVIMRDCEDIVLNGNNIAGLADGGERGIYLLNSRNVSLTGNVVRGFQQGIRLERTQNVAIHGNNLVQCQTALQMQDQVGAAVTGNLIAEAHTCTHLRSVRDVTVVGNTCSRSGAGVVEGHNPGLHIDQNMGLEALSTAHEPASSHD